MTGENEKAKLTKNQRRRLKKKALKLNSKEKVQNHNRTQLNVEEVAKNPVEVEYISANISETIHNDPSFQEFAQVFKKFATAEELCGSEEETEQKHDEKQSTNEDTPIVAGKEQDQHLSRRVRKKMKRLSVAELKQLVVRPDAVEAHDVTSADPQFLVHLKTYKNTVQVPQHWCHKRKYLQGKRGIEKQPFLLPDFIAHTGIADVRGAVQEEEERKKSKQKARDRVQPKMGRVDIDYQVLHDAFFKYQTKPKLSVFGDLYYEGKEFEVKVKTKAPGILSEELKKALGMSDGVPPPWLLHMQRYGPPPAYPNLKIPGLNAPIPEGSSFGYHPGGWGKPPVDEQGRPLYGDVFASTSAPELEISGEPIERDRWGEFEEFGADEENESEEESSSEDDGMRTSTNEQSGIATPATDGISSVVSGLNTPDVVDIRKDYRGKETPLPNTKSSLYTVLQQSETGVGKELYGSSHVYELKKNESKKDNDAEDSDENRKRKRKGSSPDTSKSKKYKDFKF